MFGEEGQADLVSNAPIIGIVFNTSAKISRCHQSLKIALVLNEGTRLDICLTITISIGKGAAKLCCSR